MPLEPGPAPVAAAAAAASSGEGSSRPFSALSTQMTQPTAKTGGKSVCRRWQHDTCGTAYQVASLEPAHVMSVHAWHAGMATHACAIYLLLTLRQVLEGEGGQLRLLRQHTQ